MDISVTTDTITSIKRELLQLLPGVKSSHRVEAMARGLGWKSNAALRADLMKRGKVVTVNDMAFIKYLSDHGFTNVSTTCLTKAIENHIENAEES